LIIEARNERIYLIRANKREKMGRKMYGVRFWDAVYRVALICRLWFRRKKSSVLRRETLGCHINYLKFVSRDKPRYPKFHLCRHWALAHITTIGISRVFSKKSATRTLSMYQSASNNALTIERRAVANILSCVSATVIFITQSTIVRVI